MPRALTHPLALAIFMLACCAPARADEIGVDFNYTSPGLLTVNFALPAGHSVVAASVSGLFSASLDANPGFPLPVSVLIDGVAVATSQVVFGTNTTGSFLFTFASLAAFSDGAFVVSCGGASVNCFARGTVTLSTAPTSIPEPAALALLASGIGGALAFGRRRIR